MSNTNQPTGQLTPEEWEMFCSKIGLSYDSVRYNLSRGDFINVLEQYAAQQTAALREELAATSLALEAVKKERDSISKTVDTYMEAITIINREKDEAVKLLQEVYQKMMEKRPINRLPTFQKIAPFLIRISWGETKQKECWTETNPSPCTESEINIGQCGCNPNPPEIPDSSGPAEYPGKAYQPLFEHMHIQHGLTLLESEMGEIVEIVRKMDNPWISVEDRLPEKGLYMFLWDQLEGRVMGYHDGSIFISKEDGRQLKYVTHFCKFPGTLNL